MATELLISIDAARTLAHVALLAAWEGEDKQALKPTTPTRSRVVVDMAPPAAS